MRTRSRFRRITRWAGLQTSLVILLAWLASIPPSHGRFCLQRACLDRYFVHLELSSGRIGADIMRDDVYPGIFQRFPAKWSSTRLTGSPIQLSSFGFAWPTVRQTTHTPPPDIIEKLVYKLFTGRAPPPAKAFLTTYNMTLPLWLPFLIFALPTALLWYKNHRRPPAGHCQSCGYNLTGNESNKCPECGTPTSASIGTSPNGASDCSEAVKRIRPGRAQSVDYESASGRP